MGNKEKQVQEFRDITKLYSGVTIMMHEAMAKKIGLSIADHKYLGLIMHKGQMTAGELSKLTGLTTGAVTGLVDRFEKRKLATRQYDKADRRKVIIVPNIENAQKLLIPVREELSRKTTKLIASFSENEIDVLRRYFLSAMEIMKETAQQLDGK